MTPRQLQITKLVAQGKTYKQIASELGISTRTVKDHISTLLETHGTMVEAVVGLVREGVI